MENAIPENEIPEEEAGTMVYAFACAPGTAAGQSGLVLAATNAGIQRSLDGGQTWEDALAHLRMTEEVPVTALAVSPVYEREPRVLAGAPGGVFLSTDGGQTWRALLFPAPPPTVSTLAVSTNFAADETFFAGTMEDGVFISRNGGESWVTWNFGLLDLNVMCLAVSPDHATDETIFAGTETGIFRSTNGGRAWREIELPFGYDAVLSLALSPSYSANQTLFAGTENNGLWVSHDEGESWSRLAEDAITDPVNSLLLSGTDLLAQTGAGLWLSTDGGATFTNRLPAAYAEREISALLAPQGLRPGAPLLAAFTDGGIEVVA